MSSVWRRAARGVRAGWWLLLLAASAARAAPNIIMVIVDNAIVQEVESMPRTAAYLRSNGIEFTNAYVTNSLCGPSRSSILTGKYSHNTGVYTNERPRGGFEGFVSNGNEQNSVGVWLRARGYKTALIGKYINGYGGSTLVAPTYVPPGWDQWVVMANKERYYNYSLNENGQLVGYGSTPQDYLTDKLAEKASGVLANFIASGNPFFMYLAPIAPHEDYPTGTGLPTPAPRHSGLFGGLPAPRNPSFGETDITDKPTWLRNQATPLTPDVIARVDNSYRARAQTLQAADEMIGNLIEQLRRASVLSNTVIIFLSDNGFFFGEHQKPQGNGPTYEVVTRVPLLMAGPGIAPASRSREIVANIDLFPTIAELAGLDVPSMADGRSLAQVATSPRRGATTGRKSLLKVRSTMGAALRLPSYSYHESYRANGALLDQELYDLEVDPDETRNLISTLTAESVGRLQSALQSFRRCAGAECRLLENTVGDELVTFAAPLAASRR